MSVSSSWDRLNFITINYPKLTGIQTKNKVT